MNTQAERRRDARVSGFTYLTKIAAWIELRRQAHMARRHEMRLREMLKTLPPVLLKDIGLALDAGGGPGLELTRQNPHVIVTRILDSSSRRHEPR